ncbi:copper amine oxidase N-terminal domain-containing protein [Paenibacillus kandeliae]|uniref:copper amine oxidase N-terminal domain-containing protein n=1 Tax=Paenibacillus kandeliae TaxID=3231269 RepID=UPI00345B0C1E
MNMKQLAMTTLASLILTSVIGTIAPVASAATSSVEVLLNARKMSFPDAKPFQDENSAVMVPIRFVSEKLGAKVGWSNVAGRQTVTLKTDDHSVVMTVGSTTAVIDGESKQYDSKVILKQSRTFVPLRLVSEGLGQPVNWDQVGKWVWIGSKDVPSITDLNLKKQSIASVKKYFKTNDYFLKNSADKPYKEAAILQVKDLPVKIDGVTIYDIQPVNIDGGQYFRVRTDRYSQPLLYLTKKEDFRLRSDVTRMMTKNGDKTMFYYFNLLSHADVDLQGIVDKNPLRAKDLDYVMMSDTQENSLVLLSNPWRQ